MNARERLFVALDTPHADRAVELARELADHVGGFKLGLELFASHGPGLLGRIRELGRPLFVDLKLHDIPNTVAGAAAALGRHGVRYFTLHALGGPAMIRRGARAAAEAAVAADHPAPLALAVTVLTSHDDASLAALGLGGSCRDNAVRLAAMARDAGAGGVVCSPFEIEAIRGVFPGGTLVVPGIRPAGWSPDDQRRVATPAEAIARGADLLVIGRPITRAPDPIAAARAIADEIATASR